MRRFPGVITLLLSLIALGCCEETTSPPEATDLSVILTLHPAEKLGYAVTKVTVALDTLQGEMDVVGSTATWSLSGVGGGEHELSIGVHVERHLLAQGTGYIAATDNMDEPVSITFVDWTHIYPDLPRRILFIGNSHTFFNGGMDVNLMALAASIDSILCIVAERIAGGSLRLEEHWQAGLALESIRNGAWDIVSLRGSYRTLDKWPASYQHYVGLFDEEIRRAGGRTVLPAMWAGRDYPEIAPQITERIGAIAAVHDVSVLPYASVWARAVEERPDIAIHNADGGHPSPHGTYLSTCIAFATLFQLDPRGATYVTDASITPAERDYLQGLAFDTVSELAGR